jgi:energy-converting hydrogenase Eha subunit C
VNRAQEVILGFFALLVAGFVAAVAAPVALGVALAAIFVWLVGPLGILVVGGLGLF